MGFWQVITSDEYDSWFLEQHSYAQAAIHAKILLLREFGVNLGRPYVDTLKGSNLKNLKELRINAKQHIYRVAFVFDKKRRAILLTGGDKKGKNQTKFYNDLIQKAELIYEFYQ